MSYFAYTAEHLEHLRQRDPALGATIDAAGFIQRATNPDVLCCLLETIIGQQISGAAARSITERLRQASGMDAHKIHAMTLDELRDCGVGKQKAGYIKNIAQIAIDGEVNFADLHRKTDAEIIEILTAIKGIGIWSAKMILIFSLNRLDVISYEDLAIRRGMMKIYGLDGLSKADFDAYAARYSPYASVASLYLWWAS